MTCNKEGVQCQPAGAEVGAGDTELIQMTGRRSGGNCRLCGGWLREDDGGCTKCERKNNASEMGEEGRLIGLALNKAIAADERRPFVIVIGQPDYTPCRTPEEAVRLARRNGNAAAYVYEADHHPANDPRSPIVAYTDGVRGMYYESWLQTVREAEQDDAEGTRTRQ